MSGVWAYGVAMAVALLRVLSFADGGGEKVDGNYKNLLHELDAHMRLVFPSAFPATSSFLLPQTQGFHVARLAKAFRGSTLF